MSDYKPKISVIIPCYNQARFLPDAIASVQAQTYPYWECIVINDGSSDNTREVAEQFIKTDTRIYYLGQSNMGLSTARNRGLESITGQYVQFLDSDDKILPKKFEKQLPLLEGKQNLALAYCNYRRGGMEDIDAQADSQASYRTAKYGDAPLLIQLASHWETRMSIPPHCFLFDSRFFSEYRIRFDTELNNHEDWDCWMRIANLSQEVFYCDEVLAIYRYYTESMSHDSKSMRSGFLHAIDKQIHIFQDNPDMLKILKQKRRETIRSYAKFFWYGQTIIKMKRFVKWILKKSLPIWIQRRLYSAIGKTLS